MAADDGEGPLQHTTLRDRACAVSTLVNAEGSVVGYCEAGRQCRTMDWRPAEDRCLGPRGNGISRYRAITAQSAR